MKRVKQLVHARKVYEQGYTGKNIRAAVLDTGVFLHPDIRENVVAFYDFVSMRHMCYDDNGHGTHVAGILCANGGMRGMAPDAKLVALKVLEEDGGGETECVLRALNWVLANHRRLRIRILNFSVGFLPGALDRQQQEIMERLDRLWDEGIAVVTAAGNNGPRAGTVTAPGISRKVITVGASDGGGYSGSGPTGCCIIKPEILAPGTDVLSLGRSKPYVRKSGTSMATPVVCGALALALEKNPAARPEQLKLALYRSARRERGVRMGWGVLDVDKLLEMV